MVRRALGIFAVNARNSSPLGFWIRRLEAGMYPLRISMVTNYRIHAGNPEALARGKARDPYTREIPRPLHAGNPATLTTRKDSRCLNTHDRDEFFDGVGGSLQCGALVVRQLELDDFLGAARPELDRHADEETADAVLAVQPDGTWENLLAVEHDRVDHLGDRRRSGVIGTARLEEVDDLGPTVARALHDGVDAIGLDQRTARDSRPGAHPGPRDHLVAVPTEDVGLHVAHRHVELLGDECAEARGIEDTGHADHALAGKTARFERQLGHRIERGADDDQGAVGWASHQLAGHALNDVLVGLYQVVALHAPLAW